MNGPERPHGARRYELRAAKPVWLEHSQVWVTEGEPLGTIAASTATDAGLRVGAMLSTLALDHGGVTLHRLDRRAGAGAE
jgi:hypothetical protein